jgi:hypothetical protein
MKKKGNVLFWEVPSVVLTPEKLAEIGLGSYLPRNSFETAMIKALRKATKGGDKKYGKSIGEIEVTFVVHGYIKNGIDIDLDKNLSFSVSKIDGSIAPISGDETSELYKAIREHYDEAVGTLNSEQIRTMILKKVKEDLHGVPLRQSGGIYFVDERFDEQKQKLEEIFRRLPDSRLHAVPVYDDQGTLDAIEDGASTEIFGEIDRLIGEIDGRIKKGELTKRQLEGRRNEADVILAKIKIHQENLRSKADAVTSKLLVVSRAIKKLLDTDIEEPMDFMEMLRSL